MAMQSVSVLEATWRRGRCKAGLPTPQESAVQMELRHELDEREWATIQTLLTGPGRPADQARRTMDGILWVMHTGHDWNRLPERYGPCEFVQQQFCSWAESGLL